MRKQFAVIGLGRFGSSVAKRLSEMGHDVLALDNNKENVQQMSEFVTQAVQGNALDEDVLRELGLSNFDSVIVAIGEDVQANIMVTVMLKELNVKHVVSKALNDLHGRVLSKVGADQVVFPERDMGVRLASNLVSSNVLDLIEVSEDFSIVEILAANSFIGKTLIKINLRAKYGINVIAIKSGGCMNLNPAPEDLINKGDILIVTGSSRSIENLINLSDEGML